MTMELKHFHYAVALWYKSKLYQRQFVLDLQVADWREAVTYCLRETIYNEGMRRMGRSLNEDEEELRSLIMTLPSIEEDAIRLLKFIHLPCDVTFRWHTIYFGEKHYEDK